MAVVIAVVNPKGGVGKTSTCKHLAGALARQGRRVLLVDNDPQASLTKGFWGKAGANLFGPNDSVAALYDPRVMPMPGGIIRVTDFPGIYLLPGSRALSDRNMTPRPAWASAESAMRDFLAEASADYDVILIDNPPSLYLCSHASLVASDRVLIPAEPEDLAVQGIEPVLDGIAAAQAGPNPDLSLLGILLTKYDRRLAIHNAFDALLREYHGNDVFRSSIPLSNDFKLADNHRVPMVSHRANSAASWATIAVAEELLGRLAATKVAAA
jgi:chromosome partitioning protein